VDLPQINNDRRLTRLAMIPRTMKSKTKTLLLAAGLLLFPALSAHASVDSILRIDLRCYYQKSASAKGPNDYGDVGQIRINAKHLIALTGKAMGKRFPDGGQLKVTVDGRVFVTDSDGDVISNVSKYIQVKLVTSERLFDGKANRETLVEGSKNYFPLALTFQLPGLKGSVEGIGIEEFRVSSANSVGVQIVSGEIDATVNGKGAVDGKLAYFTGELDFNGRKAILSN
jgi:hypothetical protein